MGVRRFLAIVALGMALVLLMLVWFFPTRQDFYTDNPYWNGASDLSPDYPASPLWSLSGLPVSPQGASLILIPYLDFVPADLQRLSDFVTQGGTLVLADDYGHGNQVLEYLGLKERFSGQTLLDPLVNYKNKWFPRILQLKSGPLTDGVTSIILNHATCITNVETDNVIAMSSTFSFLDLNGNGVWNKGEPTGPLPVVSQHNLGRGWIILVSDPSVFINSMEAVGDNSRFIQNIAAAAFSLLIDQSHLPPTNLRTSKRLLAQIRGSLVAPVGTFGLVLVSLAVVLRPIWQKRA